MASMYTHDYSNEILINSAIDITDVNDTLANWSSYFKIPIQLNQDIHYAMYVSSASITNTIDQFHSTESVFKLNATKLVVNVDIIHANTTALCAYLTQLCDAADIDLIFTLDPATQRIVPLSKDPGATSTPLLQIRIGFDKFSCGIRF